MKVGAEISVAKASLAGTGVGLGDGVGAGFDTTDGVGGVTTGFDGTFDTGFAGVVPGVCGAPVLKLLEPRLATGAPLNELHAIKVMDAVKIEHWIKMKRLVSKRSSMAKERAIRVPPAADLDHLEARRTREDTHLFPSRSRTVAVDATKSRSPPKR